MPYHIVMVIEIFRSHEGFLKYFYMLHAVEPECAVVIAQAAVANQVPATAPAHDTVWLDLAMRHLIVVGTIVHSDPLLLADCLAQIEQQRGIRSVAILALWKDKMGGDSFQAFSRPFRKHT